MEYSSQGREDQRLLMFSAMAGARSARPNMGDAAAMEVAFKTGSVQPLQLSTLFDQLTVECSGQLVHPQWKHFRHMMLVKSERTRLSNAIWRSWYLQVIKERRPLYCSFNVIPPAQDQSHKGPQAVVLEGKYWRRKIEAVAEEYHKWRKWYWRKRQPQMQLGEARQTEVAADPSLVNDMTLWDLNLDVPDSLFTSNPEAVFTQSREWNMDVTNTFQPNLTMLNPAIEDILGKLEPMEVLFPGLMAPPSVVPAPQGRVESAPTLYSSTGSSPVAGSTPVQEMLPPAHPFKVPRPPSHPITIARPREEPAPMSVSPMLSFMDKPGPSTYQQPMDGPLPPAKDIKQEPLAEVEAPFANYHPPAASCPTVESLLNQPMFPQSTQQAVGVAMSPSSQLDEGFPVHPPPLEVAPDASQDNRPFGNKLFDEKAQLHKSISSLQKLEQVQRQQMRELDKQRQRATLEYQDLLRQYISQTGEASTAQQQMLHSVVSDPTMMGILQNVLLQAQTLQQPLSAPPAPPPHSTPNVFDAVATQPSVMSYQCTSTGESGGIPTDTRSPSICDTPPVTGADSTLMTLLTTPGRGGSSQSSVPAPGESPPISLKNRSLKDMSQEEQHVYKEQRRQSHISAEQKRRGNIKHGFDRLQAMVIKMTPPSAGKMSKASVLLKSIEHIQHLQKQRQSQEAELDLLKNQLSQLNSTINVYQEQLPVSGAPVTSQRFEENRHRFKDYVFARTAHNYKFWIFAAITRQLFESYNTTVSTSGSVDELCRAAMVWVNQNCTLPQLRRGALQGLREVSTSTAILTDPARVPQQVSEMVAMAAAHSQRSSS